MFLEKNKSLKTMERSRPENRMSDSGAGAGLEKIRWSRSGSPRYT